MAKRRNQRVQSNRRTTRKSRPINRQLHRAIGMRLVRASLPADPPVRPLMHEYAGIVRVNIIEGTTTEITKFGAVGEPATATMKTGGTLALTYDNACRLIIGFMGYTADSTFEINIRKVSVWGPVAGDVAPVLSVDLSDTSGGLILTDKCGMNHRPRVGISSPFNMWLKPDAGTFCTVKIPSSSNQVGVIDLSMAWRRYKLL